MGTKMRDTQVSSPGQTSGHWLVSLLLTRELRMPMKIVTPTTVQSQILVLFSNGDVKTVPLHLTPLTMWGYQEVPLTMMGAHTLGQMNAENSGHSGVLTVGEANDFNNQYFKDLVDPSISWKHRAISTKIQWNAPGIAFMLNIDVALYIDIQTDADGESSCDFTTCEAAPTATAVEAFAESNEVWIPAFTEVFTKMLAHGSTELYDPEDA